MAEIKEKWSKFVNSATLVVLKEICKDLNLATTGPKASVIVRIQDAVKDFSDDDLSALIPDGFDGTATGSSTSSEDTSSYDAEEESVNNELVRLQNLVKKKEEVAKLRKKLRELEMDDVEVSSRTNGHTFRDVEDAIPAFSGDDTYPVQRWINQFEESAEMLKLNEREKFIYSKRLLTGTAKLLMRSTTLKSWNEIKQALLKEFSTAVTDADIHNMLRNTRKERDESIQQYVLRIQEIASQACICEDDIIYYIIKGIPDSDNNKLILYNANSLDELKLALRKYEKLKLNACNTNPIHKKSHSQMHKVQNKNYQSQTPYKIKCYNCNKTGHLSKNCSKPKINQITCFKCKQLGHTAAACSNKSTLMTMESNANDNEMCVRDQYFKKSADNHNDFQHYLRYVFYNNVAAQETTLLTLLDSGSPISIIQKQYVPNYVTTVAAENVSYFGINGSPLNILGKISIKICYKNLFSDFDLLVVQNNTMIYPVVLGRDFLAKNDLVLQKKNENLNKNENTEENENMCGNKNKEENGNECKNSDDRKCNEGSSMHVCISNDDSTVSTNKMNEFINQLLNIDVSNINDKHENVLKINNNLPHDVKRQIEDIVEPARFIDTSQVPNTENDFKMKILLTKNDPFYCTPRRLPYAHKLELEKILKDLLNRNIIRESNSPYASPIVLVQKKNGEFRLCIDYRELNKVTLKDNFPLPLIDDHLDRLKNKRYFTTLDLKNGFHHVKIDDDSIKYTAFTTPIGQYEYLRMPFGLKNAPSVFERYMKHIFGNLISSGKILTFIDDILIATETIEEHLKILEEVIKVVKENCLQLRIDKCSFMQNEVVYLGYKVNVEGIRPNDDQLRAVRDFPIPSSAKTVQSFLGLCSYFRKFIKDFASIAKPLYDLLKKDVSFTFGPKEYGAFENLKRKLIESPVLSIYSPHNETELHCDASSIGFGAVLMQKQKDNKFHPVFYFSKRASEAETRYHSFELETLAIIYALRRFRVYLIGIDFKIVTDCQSFTLTLSKKTLNPRISRWALELQSYNYKIEHRNGNRMPHADALSRSINILNVNDESFEFVLAATQRKDPKIAQIISDLEKSESSTFEMLDGLIYRKVKDKVLFYVPQHMETQVIRTHHEAMSHLGVDKCFEYLSRSYWFPEMKSKIKQFIKTCLKCMYYSPDSGKSEGTLHSIPKGKAPFDTIHVDHLGPLANTRMKRRHILVVIDGFTKFVKLYAVRTTTSKENISCLQSYFENYSRPKRIISDRGTCFTSEEFCNFMRENNIQHIKIATQSPQSNGQVERVNRVLIPMLSKECESQTTADWDKYLVKIEFSLNNTINRSTGFSPSMLLFGRNQRGEFCDKVREFLENNFGSDQKELDSIRDQASKNTEKNQAYNKSRYDKAHKCPIKYNVGDYVLIKNIVNTPGINKKLHAKYRGPYEVSKVLRNDRYLIKDIEGMQISRVPYKGVCSSSNMRPFFIENDVKNIHESKSETDT